MSTAPVVLASEGGINLARDLLAAAKQGRGDDSGLLVAAASQLADTLPRMSCGQRADTLWAVARLRGRGGEIVAAVEKAIASCGRGSGLVPSGRGCCSPRELSCLVWALSRLELSQRPLRYAATAVAAAALPHVETFDPTDLARLAAALCRLGAAEEAWQLYSRAQRSMPGSAGVKDLRGTLLGASERDGRVGRALAVLAHLAIFPHIACSPTWRVLLASSAVVTLRRLGGRQAAKAGLSSLSLLAEPGKNKLASALADRLSVALASGAGDGEACAEDPANVAERETALSALESALRAVSKDRAADTRKEFSLVRHVSEHAFPWSSDLVLREMEAFASRRVFLKLAGGVKRRLLERVAREAPPGLVVELGTYIGYSSIVLARARGAGAEASSLPRVVTSELEAVNAVVARGVLALAGLTSDIEVWVGSSEDVAAYVRDRFGSRSVAMLFMDHRGSIFHEDLRSFEELDLLVDGARVVADNVLKPGAPHFLWSVCSRARASGSLDVDLVALPEFGLGHQVLEDWMAVCHYKRAAEAAAVPMPPFPSEIEALAERCDAMRRQSFQRGGVSIEDWGVHAAAMKASLSKLSIVATLTDGELGAAAEP